MLKIETVLLTTSAFLFLCTNMRFILKKGTSIKNINLNFLLFNVSVASSCILGLGRVHDWRCILITLLSCACFCVANFGIYDKKKDHKIQ